MVRIQSVARFLGGDRAEAADGVGEGVRHVVVVHASTGGGCQGVLRVRWHGAGVPVAQVQVGGEGGARLVLAVDDGAVQPHPCGPGVTSTHSVLAPQIGVVVVRLRVPAALVQKQALDNIRFIARGSKMQLANIYREAACALSVSTTKGTTATTAGKGLVTTASKASLEHRIYIDSSCKTHTNAAENSNCSRRRNTREGLHLAII
mmetsp:Transcript_41565/g.79422  ORF Transcript_41565/g.79422 Transcript_41565/m.79422 type:complete len:205 (+) Transcript_41565:1090-1704(+)